MGYRKQTYKDLKLKKRRRRPVFGLKPKIKHVEVNMSVGEIDRITNRAGTAKGNVVCNPNVMINKIFRPGFVYTPPAPSYWEAPEPKELKDHALAPKQHDVIFTPLVKAKIDTLMSVYPSIEWLVYLSGKREGNTTIVDDLIIPVQSVTSVRVSKIELDDMGSLPIVGVMHSHHGMGNGFSGTDDMYINANHLLSLCISHGGINGQFRWKTPEGDQVVINAPVKIKYEFDFDVEDFKKSCKENISEIRYQPINFTRMSHPMNGNVMNPYDDFNMGMSDDDTDIAHVPNDYIVVPDNCPSCLSEVIIDVGDGWYCYDCGNEYYPEEDDFGDIGFNDVPPEEYQNFDGLNGSWIEDSALDNYPLLSEDCDRAEALGYIQCEKCTSYYKLEDIYKGKHPTDHIDGDPNCVLCKDCYVELKYSNAHVTTPGSGTGWNTSKATDVSKAGIKCDSCTNIINLIHNCFRTPIGNLCRGCYNLWNKEA